MGDGWVSEGERATAVRREGLGSCKGISTLFRIEIRVRIVLTAHGDRAFCARIYRGGGFWFWHVHIAILVCESWKVLRSFYHFIDI